MTIQQSNLVGNYAGLKRACFIIFTILMATSCSMSRVAIDVLVPPENKPDDQLTKCGWINRVNPDKGYVEYYINGSFINQTSNFNDRLGNLALRRVEQFSNDLGYFYVKQLHYQEGRPMGTFDGPMMRRSLVMNLCRDFNVDYIIALEGFDTDIDVDQSVTYSPGVDRNFGIVSVPMFDGLQTITMQMYFRIYDREGNVVHTDQESSQIIYSTTGDYPGEMHRKMRSSEGLLNEAAEKIADLYVNQISPHWKTRSRSLYTTGSPEMNEAYAYVQANNWEYASKIWFNLIEYGNKTLAKRASYNMILASEVSGDLDLAIEWANKCITEYKSNKALSYLSTLKERKKEIESISQLFPNSSEE